jgi:AcrR family transcriptional regulator
MTDRRNQILQTAIEMIADEGNAELSMRALARVSEMKLGALQYHFRTADALLRAVVSHIANAYDLSFKSLKKIHRMSDNWRFLCSTRSQVTNYWEIDCGLNYGQCSRLNPWYQIWWKIFISSTCRYSKMHCRHRAALRHAPQRSVLCLCLKGQQFSCDVAESEQRRPRVFVRQYWRL